MTEEKEDGKPVVAFLGPRASYTHQATLEAFPSANYTLRASTTIEDVFAAVQSGAAHRGVVPFENSTNGSVVYTLDLFADLQKKYQDILVTGEAYIAVQHCLLGRKRTSHKSTSTASAPSTTTTLSSVIESPLSSGAATPTTSHPSPQKPTARPTADLSRIRKLYSHPQAWGQCKSFLNTYLKGVERQDVSSTSRAAELVARDAERKVGDEGEGESAAVSSVVAGEIFGLDVLARGIEDRADNTTRFFIIKKGGTSPLLSNLPASQQPQSPSSSSAGDASYKTLILFTIDHSNPGALASSLSVFATHGLNLTSINTRPSGVENWNYIFFVEIQGRKLEGEEEEGNVNRALRDLGGVCRGLRWLGSWEGRVCGVLKRSGRREKTPVLCMLFKTALPFLFKENSSHETMLCTRGNNKSCIFSNRLYRSAAV